MRLVFLTFFLILESGPARVLDSIAVTVGREAITESAVNQEIALSALEDGKTPRFSPEERRDAANRLVEQALIRREMRFGNYPDPSKEELDSAYQNTVTARGGPAAVEAELARYQLTSKELRNYIAWQLALLKFIELRFRPAVQVSREDVDKYYQEQYAAVKSLPTGSALREIRNSIAQKLTGERADEQMDEWMKEQKQRTTIRFLDASLGQTRVPAPGERIEVQPH